MDHGHGINNRDKKTYKDRKKGKFSKQKKQNIYDAGVLPEFTVESDGTSYKSSDKPKKRLMAKRELRKTINKRVVRDSLSEGMSEKSTQVGKNVIEGASLLAADNAGNLALGAAAFGAAEGGMTNVTSHIGKANKALGEAIRTKKYDPAANEAVRRMKKMDKSPTMMYGKPSSPLKSGSPLAKYGCTGKH